MEKVTVCEQQNVAFSSLFLGSSIVSNGEDDNVIVESESEVEEDSSSPMQE